MKRFNNLSRTEALKVYPELLENSKLLLDSGKLLSEKERYGVATSLTILSGEELIKSFLLYCHGHEINLLKLKELKNVFHNHISKHNIAKATEILSVIEGLIQWGKFKGKHYSETKWLNKVARFFHEVLAFSILLEEIPHNLEWWEKANDLKKRGFYVDYNDDLISPTQISADDFHTSEQITQITKSVYNRFRMMRLVMEKMEKNDRTELIWKINKALLEINK